MDRRGATSLPVLIEELSPVCLANFSRNMLSLNLLCTAVNPRGYVLQTRDPAPFLGERIFTGSSGYFTSLSIPLHSPDAQISLPMRGADLQVC